MNRNQECILTIYEEGSFSKAADRLFVSQPALSIIVKKTEEELGISLFNRNSKPIKLTAAGEFYIEYIKKLQAAEEELQEQLNGLREQEAGTLNIGGSNFFCSYKLPGIFMQFKERYPKYKVALTEGNPQYLQQLLQNSDLDLIVGVEQLDTKIYSREFWMQERLLLAVSATAPINEELADYRLTFEDIQNGRHLQSDCPEVSIGRFAKQDFYLLNRGNDGYNRTMTMCRNAGFKPNVVMYLDQMMTIYNATKSGKGCALIREDIVKNSEPTAKLYFYKLDDALSSRDIYIYYKKANAPSTAARHLIQFLLEGQSDNSIKF